MADRTVVATMKMHRRKHQKSALRVIEEALHLLLNAPGMLLSIYYLGSVPFVLGLLYFWADMSRSAHADEYSAAAALGLAGLFVWMKAWQRLFALRVQTLVSGSPHQGSSWRSIAADKVR